MKPPSGQGGGAKWRGGAMSENPSPMTVYDGQTAVGEAAVWRS
jgi:hypothetical protein